MFETLNMPRTDHWVNERQVAYVQTYMMLTAFSFENLIKGAHTALTPLLAIEQRIRKWNKYKSGHGLSGLSRLIDPHVVPDAEEAGFLSRLQEYSLWAGRYPIPKDSNQLFSSEHPEPRLQVRTTDPQLSKSLFAKYQEVLKSNETESW